MDFDKAVYKARIDEIDKDQEIGRISPEAAKAAKTDEGRKLIALSENVENTSIQNAGRWGIRLAIICGVFLLPAAAVSTYLKFGNPGMPDQSLASRLAIPPENQSIAELVSRAEEHLARNPEDVRGWAVLAPVYTRLGRDSDALKAWSNVYRLAPQTPEIKATLAESMLAVSQGVVTARARKLFEAELAENPASAKARFYLAMALGQEGKFKEAVAAWQKLINGGTDASPWMAAAKSFLAEAANSANISLSDTEMAGSPGPSREQIKDASQMSSEDRNAMIEEMVGGLAEKLKENPNDKAGWQRLIRSYIVLGKKDKALEAIKVAGESLADDAQFVDGLQTIKKSLN